MCDECPLCSDSKSGGFSTWFDKTGWNEKYKYRCFEAWCAALMKAESVSTSTNIASLKLPEFKAVESEFSHWWHTESRADKSLSYHNLKKFYEIIVRQLQA